MGTQGTGRKRHPNKEQSTAEGDALNLIAREAEARLAAKRAARAEAREIRMKELERQQKEISDDDERMSVGSRSSVREDKDFLEKGARSSSTLSAATLCSLGGSSSRRGSGETSQTGDTETSIREIKEIHELKDQIQDVESKYMQSLKEVKDALVEVEEKYRKAMVSNAQLDNEKNNLMYQVDTLKDSLMELEELLSESRRGYEEKTKDFDREKHAHGVLQFQFNTMKETLKQSEELLTEIRQMRLKQDVLFREISDLQETVEWKDKKIGALERQKEYSDAIRNERDELRDEVVQLKDILKKHGIVLGPDLTLNGETQELGTEGSESGDPAPRLVQDSQMSTTEGGNSMLGSAQEMELECRGDKVMEPGRSMQQEDRHEEEAGEIKVISPNTGHLACATETVTVTETQPFSTTLVDEVEIEDREINQVSDNGISGVVQHGPICDSEVLLVETPSEDTVTGDGADYKAASIDRTGPVEVTYKGDMGTEYDKADGAEITVPSDRDDTEDTSSIEPTLEYRAAEETDNQEVCTDAEKMLDLCPQPRESIEDIVNYGAQISLGNDLDSSTIEAHREPKPVHDKSQADALPETNESQQQAHGGKKKKKGKKKRGMSQDEEIQDKTQGSTEKDVVSIKNRTQVPQGTDLDTSESTVESIQSEALTDTADTQLHIPKGTDCDTSKSQVKSKPEPQSEPLKINYAESLSETVTETQSQIFQETDCDTSKSEVESKPEPQSEPLKTKNDEAPPESTDKQPPAQGGKKKKKGKKKGEKQDNVRHECKNQKSKTEKDLASTPVDKETVDELVEDIITVEAQQLLEVELGCLQDREVEIPKETTQNIAEEGWNLKEAAVVVSDVNNKEHLIKIQEVFQSDQAEMGKVVTKKKKKKIKKEQQKPSMESDKSDVETSLLCHGSNIGIADSIDHQCVIGADDHKEEATTNTHPQKDKLGYANSSNHFEDRSLATELSTPGNSNDLKVEDIVAISVEEAETIQETKEQEYNDNRSKVLRPGTEPEDLISLDCSTVNPDGDGNNSVPDQAEAGQYETNGSPVEPKLASKHEDSLRALSANGDKCNSSSEENCTGASLDRKCSDAETVNLPEQLADLTGCPDADKDLNENKNLETLDAGEASNDQISTDSKLNDIETQSQEPVEEIVEEVFCFRQQGQNVVAEADDHIEVNLKSIEDDHKPTPSDEDLKSIEDDHKPTPSDEALKSIEDDHKPTPSDEDLKSIEDDHKPTPSDEDLKSIEDYHKHRPSVEGDFEAIEDDENDGGTSFDFDDLDSEVSVQSPVEFGQEMSLTSEGVEAVADEEEEDGDVDKSFGKPPDIGERVGMMIGQQPLEEVSKELQSPEAKSQTVVEGNEEQCTSVHEVVNVTCARKDISKGVSVNVEQQEGELSERLANTNNIGCIPVEEGEEAIQYGSQQGSRESIQSIGDSAGGDNEPSSTALKKGSKKGKGKGKEDCRMS
ncbi:hypothetical protein DPEC_G00042780 [Dallia pectoralis]|uniref:Uncharacterized protein n=1 Tax=Dallia pectoralis TaxID=75939 RepID=A0ACC2H927_DALPE|nr:hypothetical protein DPEC_G00042780 [Dallia pectoralis]